MAAELNLEEGPKTSVEGTAGVIRTPTTMVPVFTLGSLSMSLSPTVSDLSGLVGPDGERVAGILGSDAFGGSVLVFDFERERLAISAPDEAGMDAAACGRRIVMTDDNGIPRLMGEIDGAPIPLRYDSGAGLFDSPDLWINLSQPQHALVLGGRAAGEPTMTLSGGGVGGQLELPVHAANAFRLGPLEWSEPRLIVQPRQGYFAREDAVGFLGNAAFRPFGLVIVDYPGGSLILPPAA